MSAQAGGPRSKTNPAPGDYIDNVVMSSIAAQ
jgi:hypothetical protein